jgi:hypothetical protein
VEAMMKSRKNLDACERPASTSTNEHLQTADKPAPFHRASWQGALAKIAGPAFRLHHYRQAHNRLLQNALCELDCTDTRGCNS